MLAFLRADYLKLFLKFNKIVKKERGIKMSITVNLYYKGVNGNARKFMEEMENSGTADAIRAEKGNLRYDYFIPAKDPETVLLIDSWENQEAIDVHHVSPMMAILAKLRDKYDLHMTVERYVSDDTDIDSEFIRK
ncbi:antibiotic biosynthesis monooxygenase [Streptococcus equinus ATCC 9812]|uniref:Antibiotic biosynthesis monooxygenase n=2 Tax=Streptococcus equinus TaxID=1335 RepID=E8JNE9_STREI|nr:antibiotic biosynthesis monooxygenase [Streptococcus equinus ATCC 9812]